MTDEWLRLDVPKNRRGRRLDVPLAFPRGKGKGEIRFTSFSDEWFALTSRDQRALPQSLRDSSLPEGAFSPNHGKAVDGIRRRRYGIATKSRMESFRRNA